MAQVLKSLNKTYQNLKRKPVAVDLDPKAVTCDELFGIINPATREWKDGKGGGVPDGAGRAGVTGRHPRPRSPPLAWAPCTEHVLRCCCVPGRPLREALGGSSWGDGVLHTQGAG